MTITGPSSGPTSESAYATSSADVLIITSNTTYTLTFFADLFGPAGGSYGLLANGVGVAGTYLSTFDPWTNYSASFTTSGASDSRVGTPLRAQFGMGASFMGGGNLTVTNIALDVSPVLPKLTILRTNNSTVRLSWSTNFNWYSLESASNVTDSIWLTVTNVPSSSGSELVVDFELLLPDQRVFRLRQP
jgi:hypothetical protein